ncbi:MAG: DUF5684 domain-containing protein [Methanosarcinaceae archaeon]
MVDDGIGLMSMLMVGLTPMLIYLGIIIIFIASYWKIFAKSGQPGWAAIIPIYNIYILLKIVCRPSWWLLLYIIPFVNIIVSIIVTLDLSTRFNKGTEFGIGLILLPIIFYPILGFGDATYTQCD